MNEKSMIQLHFWITDIQALNYGIRQGHHIVDVDADELTELLKKIKTQFDYHNNAPYHHYVTNDELIPIIKSDNPTKMAKDILSKGQ